MKKIYLTSIIALGLTSASIAQSTREAVTSQPEQYTNEIVSAPRVDAIISSSRDVGDTIWFDGFEDPSLWNFIPPSGDPDPEINGWSIGDESNSWTGNAPDMNTEGNYARFVNGDPNTDPSNVIQDGPFIFEYVGEIPDLTDVPAPHLEFEQTGARFLTFQAVQVSTNGTDWITVGSNDDYEPLTATGGAPYANPDTRRFNITGAISGDPSNVMVRLFWDGAMNGPNMNYIEYGWFVDNMRIVEGASHDLTLSNANYQPEWVAANEDTWREVEYSIYPFSQLRDLRMSARATNNGGEAQSGVILQVIVSNAEGEVATLESAPITIQAGEDTLITIDGYTPPAEVGEYTLEFTLLSDEDDANPEDNGGFDSFMVSEAEYARDRHVQTGEYTNFDDAYKLGTAYYIENEVELHCIGAALSETSDIGTSFSFELLDGLNFDYISESEIVEVPPMEYLNADGEGKFFWAWMIAPVTLISNEDYLPVVNHFGGEEAVIVSMGGSSPAQTSFVYEGTEDTWYYLTSTPMVRIGLSEEFCDAVVDETISIDELENVNIQELYPNPTTGNTTLEYSLLEQSDVQIYVFDLHGRIVMNEDMGTQPVGEYRYAYDFSDQAAGMYTISIKVNGKSINKQLVVK